ncbi:MAG: hypothetical protein AMS27_09845 [Bacteroides sp. SM23_62_1]|nr:MAG: hypothetical protein AMS27_09845 [Bacteroides sp. SM23_62_1]
MIRLLKYIIFLILVIISTACIFPYDPEITRYEDVLTIDGLLTDNPEFTLVSLSRTNQLSMSKSYPYPEQEKNPETGATVFIQDNMGNTSTFYEASPGEYRSDNPGFRGIVGMSYQLFVITKNEQRYESDFVTLINVPEIDTVYAEFGSNPGEVGMEEGFHIYVDTYDPMNYTHFYRFDFEETWEFTVPYPSRYYIFDGELVPRNEDLGRCWRTVQSTDIMIISNEKLESSVIQRFPIHFVSLETNRLGIRYSILVKQYSLSREAYAFWDQLKKSSQDRGSLFDSQPVQFTGNVYNVNDPESPVIGFFEAAAVAEKRIFLTHDDVPINSRVKNEFQECRHKYYIIPETEMKPSRFDYYYYCKTDWTSIDPFTRGMGLTWDFDCCDCTRSGSNIKPDFW